MIVCADDFGISEAVSRGIIELIDAERVTATSCMVTGSASLSQQMQAVSDRHAQVDVGLHLTLTNDQPLSPQQPSQGLVDSTGNFNSYGKLLVNCYRGKVDRSALQGEISAQIKRFEELTGFLPDFIDGHQHTHQLPIVRDVLLHACADMMQDGFYIRCGTFPRNALLGGGIPMRMKIGSVLIGLPAAGLRRNLDRHDIRHNTGLLGHYSRSEKMDFAQILERYLRTGPDVNDILFVHPGYADDELRSKDPMIEQRISELEYLRGPGFAESIASRKISLNRFQYF